MHAPLITLGFQLQSFQIFQGTAVKRVERIRYGANASISVTVDHRSTHSHIFSHETQGEMGCSGHPYFF